MATLDSDTIVGLLGILMALALVSQSSALKRLSAGRRWLYGAAWAVIIGVAAVVAARLGG